MTAATAFGSVLSDALYHEEPDVSITTKAERFHRGQVVAVDDHVVTLRLLSSRFLVLALDSIESVTVTPELVAKLAQAQARQEERNLAVQQAQESLAGRLGELVTDRAVDVIGGVVS